MTMTHPVPYEELLKRDSELKESDIQLLREWCEKQPHLPKISDTELATFLYSNYCRLEPTKTTIDKYYTIRSQVPEFFNNRDPLGPKELRHAFNIVCCAPLQGKTAEEYSILYAKLINFDSSLFVYNDSIKHWNMSTDLWIRELGTMKGSILIADIAGMTFGHAARSHPMGIMKFITYLQDALPVRLKSMHFINAVPAIDAVMTIVKRFMKKELQEILYVHSTLDSVAKFVPIELLPNESGGKAGPVMELHEKSIKWLEANRDWFLEEEQKMRVNEALRPEKSKGGADVFGTAGTFKKLDFD